MISFERTRGGGRSATWSAPSNDGTTSAQMSAITSPAMRARRTVGALVVEVAAVERKGEIAVGTDLGDAQVGLAGGEVADHPEIEGLEPVAGAQGVDRQPRVLVDEDLVAGAGSQRRAALGAGRRPHGGPGASRVRRRRTPAGGVNLPPTSRTSPPGGRRTTAPRQSHRSRAPHPSGAGRTPPSAASTAASLDRLKTDIATADLLWHIASPASRGARSRRRTETVPANRPRRSASGSPRRRRPRSSRPGRRIEHGRARGRRTVGWARRPSGVAATMPMSCR